MAKRDPKFSDTLDKMNKGLVESEDIEQTHRENLHWAISAAGRFLRTRQIPIICPNDAAFFLYKQAIDQPKEFLTKVSQAEARVDHNQQDTIRRASEKSIEEINKVLSELKEGSGK